MILTLHWETPGRGVLTSFSVSTRGTTRVHAETRDVGAVQLERGGRWRAYVATYPWADTLLAEGHYVDLGESFGQLGDAIGEIVRASGRTGATVRQ